MALTPSRNGHLLKKGAVFLSFQTPQGWQNFGIIISVGKSHLEGDPRGITGFRHLPYILLTLIKSSVLHL